MFKRCQHQFRIVSPGLECCVHCPKTRKMRAVPISQPVEKEARKECEKEIQQKAAEVAAVTVQY